MLSEPGVGRDGTLFAKNNYTEFQWCRIYQGRPRKILGYSQQTRGITGIVRQFSTESSNDSTYVHMGTQDFLLRYTINNTTGMTTVPASRTPAGFIGSADMGWQFSVMTDTASSINLLFASAVPNMASISDETENPIYYGHVEGNDPLIAIPDIRAVASGGVVTLQNYLVLYGNNGIVKWSVPGNPLDFTTTAQGAGDARPVANKIVRGLPIYGTGNAAGIFWSMDSVFLMQWVGGAAVFTFNTLTTSTSILSSNGIIEHNGIYYWATTNGFSMFNGVIRDVPNNLNLLWFLENLNFAQRQKVFAFKVPRYGEIWWCFPYGNATECTHAVIFNIRENCWYDTTLPASNRTAGQYAQIYEYPIMASSLDPILGTSVVWQHEIGLDEVRALAGGGTINLAVPSWFTTQEYSNIDPETMGHMTKSRSWSYSYLEPDFDQVGDLTVDMIGRYNARDTSSVLQTITLPAVPTNAQQLGAFKRTSRLARFKVMSNVAGGNYVCGSPLLHVQLGDDRKKR